MTNNVFTFNCQFINNIERVQKFFLLMLELYTGYFITVEFSDDTARLISNYFVLTTNTLFDEKPKLVSSFIHPQKKDVFLLTTHLQGHIYQMNHLSFFKRIIKV